MQKIDYLPAKISSKSFYYSLADYLANSIYKKQINFYTRQNY